MPCAGTLKHIPHVKLASHPSHGLPAAQPITCPLPYLQSHFQHTSHTPLTSHLTGATHYDPATGLPMTLPMGSPPMGTVLMPASLPNDQSMGAGGGGGGGAPGGPLHLADFFKHPAGVRLCWSHPVLVCPLLSNTSLMSQVPSLESSCKLPES